MAETSACLRANNVVAVGPVCKELMSCGLCPYKTRDKFLLSKHLPRHGGAGKLRCAHCCYACNNADIMAKHRALHDGGGGGAGISNMAPQPLDLSVRGAVDCGSPTAQSSAVSPVKLNAHVTTGAAGDVAGRGERRGKFPCKFCSFTHDDVRVVLTHIKVHENVIPALINNSIGTVGRHFPISAAEGLNMSSGGGKPKWSCPHCPFVTRRGEGHYTDHMRHHTSDYQYKCDRCSYTSPQYNYLALHVKTHQKKDDLLSTLPNAAASSHDEKLDNSSCGSPLQPLPQSNSTPISTSTVSATTCEVVAATAAVALNVAAPQVYLKDMGSSGSIHLGPNTSRAAVRGSNTLGKDSTAHSNKVGSATPFNTVDYAAATNKADPAAAVNKVISSAPVNKLDYYRANDGSSCYVCTHCGVRLASSDIHNHVLHHTTTSTFKCDLCSYSASSKHVIAVHKRFHKSQLQAGAMRCRHCDFRCSDQRGMDLHRSHHSDIITKEETCTYTDSSRVYRCPECPQLFSSRETVASHTTCHAGDGVFQCGQCTYGCDSDAGLQRHLLVHTDKYAAANNGSVGVSDAAAGVETFAEPAVKPDVAHAAYVPTAYRCSMCPYEARSRERRESHMQHHGGPGSYACDDCNYRCSVKATLTRHVALHGVTATSVTKRAATHSYWGSESPTLVRDKRPRPGGGACNGDVVLNGAGAWPSSEELIEARLREIDSEMERTLAATHVPPLPADILHCTQCATSFTTLCDIVSHVKDVHPNMCTNDDVRNVWAVLKEGLGRSS